MSRLVDFPELVERIVADGQDRGSHVERDVRTFHPSQIAGCKRQCCKSKFGLEDHDAQTLGRFKVGTMIHSWLEDELDAFPGLELETRIEHAAAGGNVEFTGRADCYDRHRNAVYDFKSRGGWYKFDPPSERHVDQLHVYMAALGAEYGQVVYVNKKDLEVRTWPEDGLFEFDPDRYERIVDRALDIRQAVEDSGIPETVGEIPFESCGCWICDMEENDA